MHGSGVASLPHFEQISSIDPRHATDYITTVPQNAPLVQAASSDV